MSITAGIAGGGLIGRIMAMKLAQKGWKVSLFDCDTEEATRSCTFTGAGMLAPYCEIERAEMLIAELGFRSVKMWPELLATLSEEVFYQQQGTLVVAHPNDRAELRSMERNIRAKVGDDSVVRSVNTDEVRELEPELADKFPVGLYCRYEGQLDNHGLLRALAATLKKLDIHWEFNVEVLDVTEHTLKFADGARTFDWAIDCRGLGAREQLTELRGVRGELVLVHAPEVNLNRPVRMVHPRYPIYTVPRPNNNYVIGATMLESDDQSPVSVRSLLEILSAAYSLHTGFAEARLLYALSNCRPTFNDNLPRIIHGDGLLRINGMFRHGFLISPALSKAACEFLETGEIPQDAAEIMFPASSLP